MIVLDTNVLSAVMQATPDPGIVAWLDDLPAESVWTTSITVFEVRFGIERLVSGRRRRELEEAFRRAISEDLDGRVLPFDQGAAEMAGAIAARQRRAGRPVDVRDTLIAGTVLERRATLATRNVRHFVGTGVRLVDPWRRA